MRAISTEPSGLSNSPWLHEAAFAPLPARSYNPDLAFTFLNHFIVPTQTSDRCSRPLLNFSLPASSSLDWHQGVSYSLSSSAPFRLAQRHITSKSSKSQYVTISRSCNGESSSIQTALYRSRGSSEDLEAPIRRFEGRSREQIQAGVWCSRSRSRGHGLVGMQAAT